MHATRDLLGLFRGDEGFDTDGPLLSSGVIICGVYGVGVFNAKLELGGVASSGDIGELFGCDGEVGEGDEDGDVSVPLDPLAFGGGEIQGEIPEAEVDLRAQAGGG